MRGELTNVLVVRWTMRVALAAMLGCQGQIAARGDALADPQGAQTDGANADGGGPSSKSQGNGQDDPAQRDALDATPRLATDCEVAAPPPVHRLSRTEYLNTMAALFPDYTGTLSFPADNALPGFDNEAQMLYPNQLLVDAVAANADALAAYAVQDMPSLVGCTPQTATDEDDCARTFIATFGRRALRQPLSPALIDSYMEIFQAYRDDIDFEAGIELTLAAMLQAPELMYRISPRVLDAQALPDEAGSFAAASALSYAMWQGPPDTALLDAAADGALQSVDDIREQLANMTVRAPDQHRATMIDFHRQWLDMDRILLDSWNDKDAQMFPEWTPQMVTSVHQEALDFVEDVMVDREGGLTDLLTSHRARLDDDTAALYDVAPSADVVELPQERAGIFARASFLASHGHQRNGSPPLRGIAIMERAFCMTVGQPPPDADTTNPADEPDASSFTNRELFERRSSVQPCNGCHQVINAFAYPLETFDAIGRARSTDNGKPVNTQTDLMGTDIDGHYADWPATAAAMADSDMVRVCASEHWLAFALGREVETDEGCLVSDLADGMAAGDSFANIMKRAAQYAAAAEIP